MNAGDLYWVEFPARGGHAEPGGDQRLWSSPPVRRRGFPRFCSCR